MKKLELSQMEFIDAGTVALTDEQKCIILCVAAGLVTVATSGMAAGAGAMAMSALGALWC